MEEEREKCNKIIIFNFTIIVHTFSYLRRYSSGVPKFLAYVTPHEVHILGFGVPNAKNLAYGTPAMDALNPHLAHHPKSLKYHHMLLILKRPLQK